MDKAKKKRLKQYIAWISMAAVVALLAAMPLLARKEAQADGPVASILEGTVQVGDIRTGLRGGGTLSAGNAMDVELPKGVKITEFLVNNGDSVREGDPVATVDKVSVMTAIVQVRESMEYIREEMADAKDEKAASAVKSTAGGRIKAVYAQAGDSVQDVMLRHGALAVLSLDGLMSVELEVKTALASGDPVRVTFEDGTAVSGRVESNLDGTLIVTVGMKNTKRAWLCPWPMAAAALWAAACWRFTIPGRPRPSAARSAPSMPKRIRKFTAVPPSLP